MAAKKVAKMITAHNFKNGMTTRAIYRLLVNKVLEVKQTPKTLN